MFNIKKIAVTTCLSAVVVFAATASMVKEPEEHKFTNLKVLPKNITDKEMEKVMHEWSDALGERCGFCHARNAETNKIDFASDAKGEKLAAREMYKMTAKINKKFFKEDGDKDKTEHKDHDAMVAAVSCYTSYRRVRQIFPFRFFFVFLKLLS